MSPPHGSLTMLRLQQALAPAEVQSSPAGKQAPPASHWPVPASQSLAQRSLSFVHSWPSVLHELSTHRPPPQPREQHWPATWQAWPRGVHWPKPWAHTKVPAPSSAHTPDQQVAPEQQTAGVRQGESGGKRAQE